MKIFKFKYTKLILVFIYLGLALAAAAFGVNLYLLIKNGISHAANPVYPILQYTVIFFVSVLLCVILISLLISSYYAVGNGIFKTSFGIIKSKFNLADVDKIVLDRETNKLAIYFKDGNFIMVVVKKEWYEDFIDEILKGNPKIEYTINSKQNTPDDK